MPPALLAGLSLSAAAPYNPLSPAPGLRDVLMAAMPQGWAFFTKDAREARLWPVHRRQGGWYEDPRLPFSTEWLPMSRNPRLVGVDVARLLEQGDPAWGQCMDNVFPNCLDAATASVVRADPDFGLCGEVAIVAQAPRPWSWASRGLDTPRPLAVRRFSVDCGPDHSR